MPHQVCILLFRHADHSSGRRLRQDGSDGLDAQVVFGLIHTAHKLPEVSSTRQKDEAYLLNQHRLKHIGRWVKWKTMPGIFDKWDVKYFEDIDVSQNDFQTLLDELTDAKNSLMQQNGYMPKQWVFGTIPRVPGHLLEENPDLPNLDPEGRFKRIAEMRHKCRMAAIETEANAKIRKSLVGRSRPMRGNCVPGDLVCYWRAGSGVHQAQGQWLGPARVIGIEGGNVWVSHRATAVKCANEQLRMASPAEREM